MRTFLLCVLLYTMSTLILAQATDLFISEYVEGTSNQKAIEIFNGTGAPVDLSQYSLMKQTNGTGAFGTELVFSGTLANNDCFVICFSSTGTTLVGQPYVDLATTSFVCAFNGNDAVALCKNGALLDVVGIIDQITPNWGFDITFVRNAEVFMPTVVWVTTEWTTYPVNTFSFLGNHTFTGGTTDPVISVSIPNGGESWNLGTSHQINWAHSNFTGDVKIELMNGTIPTTLVESAPNTGSWIWSIASDLTLGSNYKIRISGPNGTPSDMSDSPFSLIAAIQTIDVPNLAALRTHAADNLTIYRLTGEAWVTFTRTTRSQKYIQDNTAGILIDDPNGIISTTYLRGDGLTNLKGTLVTYNAQYEFVPILDPGPPTSQNHVVQPQTITLAELTANFENYNQELIRINNVTFLPDVTGGIFASASSYNITDPSSGTIIFRTNFSEADYIGAAIPTSPKNIVAIAIPYNATLQISSRDLADIGPVDNEGHATDLFISEYVEGTGNQKAIEIFNGTGAPVDLSQYSLKKQTNGVGEFGEELVLSGILDNNDCYVIVLSGPLEGQPYVDLVTTIWALTFNGNDCVALCKNGNLLDVVGIIDQPSPFWGTDMTLVRNADVFMPRIIWDPAEWTTYPVNTFTNLGLHFFTGGTTEPLVSVISPNGAEQWNVGSNHQIIWAHANFTSNVKIELMNDTTTITLIESTENTGSWTWNVSNNLPLGSNYLIRVSGPNGTPADMSDTTFSLLPAVTMIDVPNIADLRTQPADNLTIYRLTGEAWVTYARTARNQKYIQDNTGGILIDDPNAIITTPYTRGDGMTNLKGTLMIYHAQYEFIPVEDPGLITSHNFIAPQEVTLAELTANFNNYSQELIVLSSASFLADTTGGIFLASRSYDITDNNGGSFIFRTSFPESDYIGTQIPTVPKRITAIAIPYDTMLQISARDLADFGQVDNPGHATDLFISEYVEGTSNQKAIEIFNGTGAPVDLSQYSLKKQTNGAGMFGEELALSGILSDNDCYVVVFSGTSGTSLEGQPYVDLVTTTFVLAFNGNDCVALCKNGALLDVVGVVDQPTLFWGTDKTLIRNATVYIPRLVWDVNEWSEYSVNTFTNLGLHTFIGGTTDPIIVISSPNGGEQWHLGTNHPITWTHANFTGNVKIELISDTNAITLVESVENTGSWMWNIAANLILGSDYTIRISGPNSIAVDLSDSTFSLIPVIPIIEVADLATLRAQVADNTTIYRLTGEAWITYLRAARNQKYIQDNTGGILIDDPLGIITTPYSSGDGITNLQGKLMLYHAQFEFIPVLDPGQPSSHGHVIEPQTVTIAELNTNFNNYSQELIRIANASFLPDTTGGIFLNGRSYSITDNSGGTIIFRTNFVESDYIGTLIPTTQTSIVAIALPYDTVNQIAARYLADFQSTNPIDVADLATLRTQFADNMTVYRLTGEAWITYLRTARNQKYIQDNTAGIMIDDPNGHITTQYLRGDGLTNITGKLMIYHAQFEFVPVQDPGQPTSQGHFIEPQTVTIAELNTNFNNYSQELIRIANASFLPDTTGGLFVYGRNYTVTDESGASIIFRTSFQESDYIGTTIPAIPGPITAIAFPYDTVFEITARDLVDFPVDNDDQIAQVSVPVLFGNVPNPFTGSTAIRFAAKSSKPVTIEVYNIRGQKVATIVNNERFSGTQSISWNGKDDNGNTLPSGIYLYKMQSGSYHSTRKMIVLK